MILKKQPKQKNISYNLISACLLLLVLASCGSRKNAARSDSKAAKAANAMASLKNKQLYNFITEWTGVKYRNGGLSKKGIDCSGFALLLEKDVYGKSLPRRSRDQADAIKSQTSGRLKEGDLIFFSFGGKEVDHVGVYLTEEYFVHASTNRGVVVDNIKIPAYQNSFVKAGSIKK